MKNISLQFLFSSFLVPALPAALMSVQGVSSSSRLPLPVDTLPTILCCLCGIPILSNPANMCGNCLKTQVDITEGITKQVTLFWCRGCGRYQGPKWMSLELESRELLALCLKKVKGLHKEVKLVDAGFVYTEPHSRRLKVKLTIQKEVFNSVILQQVFVVEFFIQNLQCTGE
jgi:nonsense-mediated mRNA decay protein 3